ncbi:LysR family transcriptional regulator [Rhizobium sp. P32RR-XVIII]|uniref:LysR family transcriptional regulator n=1 Tax=Rhizobium sp. P32RR-XVIII TaxID=2726738 RepID=UPI0014568FCA|nr:LysR family transcriptional regulator [Rhizobium sp. P32RR-XVIII]NLS07352.1 LysR family transcriptional regulator [Rhizobium sp. P32RR-XVIII]
MDRLKIIGTFLQITKSGSLARAAHELGISRSLASAHLKQLEDHLGVLLVRRTTRSLVLTEAGAEYLKSCSALLQGLVEVEGRLAEEQAGERGHLKIMASMGFGNLRLGPAIVEFSKKYPGIHFTLILLGRGFAPSDFFEGDFDLGLSMDDLDDANLINAKIGETDWVLCAGKDYFDSHPAIDKPSDLKAHNCLVHRSYANDSIWRFHRQGETASVRVRGSIFTNSVTFLRDTVVQSAGVAMLPLYAIRHDLAFGTLRQVLPDYECTKRPLYIVYQDSRYLPYRARLFINYLREEFKRKPV